MSVAVAREAARMRRELARMASDPGEFDAQRYFRGGVDLKFHNIKAPRVRALARELARAHAADWTIRDAIACADRLMRDPHLEAKSLAVEVVARYHRAFAPSHLARWKAWLSGGFSSNWATTDAICGYLIGPLLVSHPSLAPKVARWARDSNVWVRRAAAVSLIPSVRRGAALALAYDVAVALRTDCHDLIHKAVGWLLREAGQRDRARLERFLRMHGPSCARTTVRYAIERFPERRRRALLVETSATARLTRRRRSPPRGRAQSTA